MRLKDQIKLIKSALKKDELYSDVEIQLKLKKLRRKKGFNNEFSKTDNRDTQRRGDDGLRSESEQPQESGKP